MNLSVFLFSSCVVALLCISAYRRRQSKAPLPPGPRPLPFIGNLHQIPKYNPSILYANWRKKYGDVIYMRIFGREFVILNSFEAITDLFEKRSANYSTRPRLVMSSELVERPRTSILFNKYGPMLKECRKLVRSWINPRTIPDIRPVQDIASYQMLGRILENPERFSEYMRLNAAAVILKLTYGIEAKTIDDPYIVMSEEFTNITSLSSQPGRWLVDSFPILKHIPPWFPGASFKRWGFQAREKSFRLAKIPYEVVKTQVTGGNPIKSWTAEQLLLTPEERASEEVLICASSSMYVGAIDTSVALIRTFVLMMVLYPRVQKKAQEEIDSVVGAERLPDFEDEKSLPYIHCLIKELLRINPIVPLIPHSLDEDDIYRGWRIPKGAWVMANLRAVFYNPDTYKNPEEFRPERFDSRVGLPERDPTETSFGFGRRFCPGFDLTMTAIFMNISRLLATFHMSPVMTKDGTVQHPPMDFDVGHLSVPKSFACDIIPRNKARVALIKAFLNTQ